jgi:hypothetical protein
MSGTIALSRDTRWSAAGWLFDWALRFVAREVGDTGLEAMLQEIIKENLGWLDLEAVPCDVRRKGLQKLSDDLLAAAEAELPGAPARAATYS